NESARRSAYTLSLHDALPIFCRGVRDRELQSVLNSSEKCNAVFRFVLKPLAPLQYWFHPKVLYNNREKPFHFRVKNVHDNHFLQDRQSTRLNSSHVKISYAVF